MKTCLKIGKLFSLLAIVIAYSAFIAGCAETPQADSDGRADLSSQHGETSVSWINPDFEIRPYDTVLVVFYEGDAELRLQAENYFADNMEAVDVKVLASSQFEPDVTTLEDADKVIPLANEHGAEALFTVEFKGFEEGYRPPSAGYSAAWLAAAVIDEDLRRAVWATSIADRALSSLASMEVRLWDIAEETKVWAATTNVQTYDNVKRDTKRFTEQIVLELRQQGLL